MVLWTSNQQINVLRRVRKKERVKKVSISLGKEWVAKWEKAGVVPAQSLQELLELPGRQIQWVPSERILKNAAEILLDSRKETMVGQLLSESCAIDILQEVFCTLENTALSSKPSLSENSHARKIQNFLETHFTEDLTLSQIAMAVGMSVSSMQRTFKKSNGATVGDYVRHKRLECARSALLFEGITVARAAQMAGYKSASNFTNAFFKQFGTLPSHVRV